MSNKKNNNNKYTYVILTIIVFILIACISVEVYIYVKNSTKATSLNKLEYVGLLEDGTYYISKAPKNIKFQIDSNSNDSYILKDKNGNVVESKIINEKEKNFIEPIERYQEGKIYYLELTNTSFSEEKFKNAKKIKFKIEKQEKTDYSLSKDLKFISDNTEIVDINGTKTIKVNDNQYDVNDILIKGNENNFKEAYKIIEIKDGTAYLTNPEISDIYEDINLYKENKVDFRNIEINEEFKDNIKVAVKKSPLYQILNNESYAADTDVDIKINTSETSIKLDISIMVYANGKAFLGIPALKNHDVTFNYSIELSSNTITDIEKNRNANLDIALLEKIDFGIKVSPKQKIIEEKDNVEELAEEVLEKLIKELSISSMDSVGGSPRVTGLDYNMGIPGIETYFDIYFPVNYSLQIDLAYNQHIEIMQNIGFEMEENEDVETYSTISVANAESELSVLGKANIKAGLEVDIGMYFISKDIANMGIKAEMGIYGDAFITTKFNYKSSAPNMTADYTGQIEVGIYSKATASMGVNIFLQKASVTKVLEDTKKPILELGNSAKLKATINKIKDELRAENNVQIDEYTEKVIINKDVLNETNTNQEQGDTNTNTNINTNGNTNNNNQNSSISQGLTINEITDQINYALNNAIKETIEKDPDVLVTNFLERLDRRYTVLTTITLEDVTTPKKYVDPNTSLSYKHLYRSLVKNVDWLMIYDNTTKREFSARIFRMSNPPLAHCGTDCEVTP